MRAFITGGLGFIGKHLCKKLLDLGHEIVAFDDQSSSADDAEELILDSAEDPDRFTSICGSVLDYQRMEHVIRENQPDVIFHLAASLGVQNIIDNQLEMLETNVAGTKNVLELAAEKVIPAFIASSSEVYGKSSRVPFKEDGDLLLGSTGVSRWGYAASKILDEFHALAYWREERLPVVVGRFFNISGPGQMPESGMVIPKMVEAALNSRPLKVFGDGSQRRCFCHVDDAVDAMCSLMLPNLDSRKNSKTVLPFGQVFNIGNPRNEISMLELAQKIVRITKSSSQIETIPYSKVFQAGSFEDMNLRIPDISKIQSFIGFQPERSLEQIVEDSSAAFRDQLVYRPENCV